MRRLSDIRQAAIAWHREHHTHPRHPEQIETRSTLWLAEHAGESYCDGSTECIGVAGYHDGTVAVLGGPFAGLYVDDEREGRR